MSNLKKHINKLIISLFLVLNVDLSVLADVPWEDGDSDPDSLIANLTESLNPFFNILAVIGFFLFGIAIVKFMRNQDQSEGLSKVLIGFGLLALAPTIVSIIFSLAGGAWF